MMMRRHGSMLGLVIIASALATRAQADDQTAEQAKQAELAKQLANPVAALISVPVQYNYDRYGGANDGAAVNSVVFQPVIPFSLDEHWNLITRTIIPLMDQRHFPVDALNQSGLGDITASQFLSPKSSTAGGWNWGAGPIELLPTATDRVLGTGKWGLGPTAVVLKQSGPWTIGYLGSHIWSVGGGAHRDNIDVTSMEPFVAYTTSMYTTVAVYTETTYDWQAGQWTVPVIVEAGQLFQIGPQILQLAVDGKYWAESPDGGPKGWGVRVQLTFLFPKSGREKRRSGLGPAAATPRPEKELRAL